MVHVKNSYRSHNGRSAVARKVMFSGTGDTDGIFPQGYIKDSNGNLVRKGYFGGNKKGGAQPNATGFMIAPGSIAATQIATRAENTNYLFIFRSSNRGPGPLTYLPTCDCPGNLSFQIKGAKWEKDKLPGNKLTVPELNLETNYDFNTGNSINPGIILSQTSLSNATGKTLLQN